MKRKNQVTTNLSSIDQGYIKRHCLDKEYWKKTWTIFKYKNIECQVKLSSIEMEYNKYCLLVSCAGRTSYAFFPFDRDDFTDKMFNLNLLSCFKNIIFEINSGEIMESSIYKGYQKIYDQSIDDAVKEAKDYCEQHKITDNDIVDSVTEAFTQKVKDYSASYLESMKFSLRLDVMAAFAYWMGLKDEAKEIESEFDPKLRRRMAAAYMNELNKYRAEKEE